MLSSLAWLVLEVTDPERVATFYRRHLDLPIRTETPTTAELEAGITTLALRRPDSLPRGGLHTHYAFAIPYAEYDEWQEQLSADLDVAEHDFGGMKSLYFDDPAGNCVELGQRDVDGSGIASVFEVVLEVADLDRARALYERLGFDLAHRGGERRRVRMTTGAFDLELWEPQLGIADGRGGVHVAWGLRCADPASVADRVRGSADAIESVSRGVRVRDPDGHFLTLVGES